MKDWGGGVKLKTKKPPQWSWPETMEASYDSERPRFFPAPWVFVSIVSALHAISFNTCKVLRSKTRCSIHLIYEKTKVRGEKTV